MAHYIDITLFFICFNYKIKYHEYTYNNLIFLWYTYKIAHNNQTTIFSHIPDDYEKNREKREISFWLEKLHTQEETAGSNNEEKKQPVPENASETLHTLPVKIKNHDATQSGIDEHMKNIARKKESDSHIVNDLIKKSNRVIVSVSSQFPLALFPNTIEVEESRVTFKFSQFFSSQSYSVDIKDISNVFIESSLFFSTLQVVSRTFVQNDIKIGYLNKASAKLVQRIIEGLRTFKEHNISTSHYEINELISKIGEFHQNYIS